MSTDFQTALTVMLVGMITVFFVLSLVNIAARILIQLVNRYTPSTLKEKKLEIDPKHIAAAAAAVQMVTGGSGKIKTLKKIES